MKAVFRHETGMYFTGLSGYVFGAFMLLFTGIYMMVYNLKGGYTNFEYVPAGMSFIFLIIVPILSMRVLAEERKQKTDQLLYSLPLSMTQVVLGKYAAMLVVMLIPTAIMCLYPLILRAYGSVYLPAAYGTVLAFYLLGAALLSIGMFISSLTESQPVAAGICFVVMLLNYYLNSLAGYVSSTAFASLAAFSVAALLLAIIVRLMTKHSLAAVLTFLIPEIVLVILYAVNSSMFEGAFPDLMQKLSLFERFYTFVYGVFDITGIVYFCSVIAVFLFLSVQSMEKRRWSE